ncbi:MAG: class I SAM-dependent methyltransferase [Elusimicrobia bacterium]|nr:class I SAM-dependent methyltransferase [Elusimicrobiota bacterium]
MSADAAIHTAARPRCAVCGGEGATVYAGIPDRLFHSKGEWTIVRCANASCGLLWLDPMPLPEDLHKAYAQYYTHADQPARAESFLRSLYVKYVKNGYLALRYGYRRVDPGFPGRLGGLLMYLLHPARRLELDCSVMYLPPREGGRLLEIGFGSCALMEHLRSVGWNPSGLDFDPVCVERAKAKGFEARTGALEDAKFPDGHFDAVVMSHAFEHVPDPIGLLREIRRVLKPGGTFVSLTPNAVSYGHGYFGRNWLALDPPRHLHLFSPDSLRGALAQVPFSSARVFTTANGADYIYLSSRDLLRSGRHTLGAPLDPAEWRRGRLFQIGESLRLFFNPDAGEELVVYAVK